MSERNFTPTSKKLAYEVYAALIAVDALAGDVPVEDAIEHIERRVRAILQDSQHVITLELAEHAAGRAGWGEI